MRQSPGWLGGKNVRESRFYIKENAVANIYFFCEIEKKILIKKNNKILPFVCMVHSSTIL